MDAVKIVPAIVADSFLSRSASGYSIGSTSDSGRQFSQWIQYR